MAFKVGDEVLCFYPKGEKYFGIIDSIDVNRSVNFPIQIVASKSWRSNGNLIESFYSSIITNESELLLTTNFSTLERLIYGI